MKNIKDYFTSEINEDYSLNESSSSYFCDSEDFESEYSDYLWNQEHAPVQQRLFKILKDADAQVNTYYLHKEDDRHYDAERGDFRELQELDLVELGFVDSYRSQVFAFISKNTPNIVAVAEFSKSLDLSQQRELNDIIRELQKNSFVKEVVFVK